MLLIEQAMTCTAGKVWNGLLPHLEATWHWAVEAIQLIVGSQSRRQHVSCGVAPVNRPLQLLSPAPHLCR